MLSYGTVNERGISGQSYFLVEKEYRRNKACQYSIFWFFETWVLESIFHKRTKGCISHESWKL
jgi:hypothetical protein